MKKNVETIGLEPILMECKSTVLANCTISPKKVARRVVKTLFFGWKPNVLIARRTGDNNVVLIGFEPMTSWFSDKHSTAELQHLFLLTNISNNLKTKNPIRFYPKGSLLWLVYVHNISFGLHTQSSSASKAKNSKENMLLIVFILMYCIKMKKKKKG